MTTLRTPTFKGKKAVIVLSWLALVFAVARSTYALIYGAGWGRIIDDMVFVIAPCILFVLYITWFHEKGKGTALLPIIFGIFALDAVCSVEFICRFLGSEIGLIHVHSYGFSGVWNFEDIACWLRTILWVAATITTAIKRCNKLFIIIVVFGEIMSFVLLEDGWFFINMLYWHGFESRYLQSAIYHNYIGNLCLYAALTIFALMAYTKVTAEEHELKTLQAQLASGKITDEEYQAKRADVIRRL